MRPDTPALGEVPAIDRAATALPPPAQGRRGSSPHGIVEDGDAHKGRRRGGLELEKALCATPINGLSQSVYTWWVPKNDQFGWGRLFWWWWQRAHHFTHCIHTQHQRYSCSIAHTL